MFRPEESGGAARLLDVEFSEDGRRVATAGSDGGIAVWDVRTGDQVSAFTTDGEVHTVQFSPDGRQVLTASAEASRRPGRAPPGNGRRSSTPAPTTPWPRPGAPADDAS